MISLDFGNIGNWFIFMNLKANGKSRKTLKIVGMTMMTLFILFSSFSAAFAWFIANTNVETASGNMPIKSLGGCKAESIRLIKYDYSTIELSEHDTIIDYFNLQNGMVNSYEYYDKEDSFGQFVEVEAGTGNYSYSDNTYVKGDDNTGNYIWQTVDFMNIYDPFDKIIKGKSFDLSALYSNALYEVTFSAPTADYLINLSSRIKTDREKEEEQIYLSTCADIDIFYEEDFETSASSYSNEKTYAINDLVVYNGAIYQCKTAIASGESFTSSHWNEVTAYSNTATYSVGKAVVYSGTIYICKTAVSTPEIFDSSKWNKASNYSNSSTYTSGDIVIHNGAVYKANTTINTPEAFVDNKWNPILYNDAYCPSFKPNLSTDEEALYYKASFLSSRKGSHKNFYESSSDAIDLDSGDPVIVRQSNEQFKIYININYSPSQLDSFHTRITSPSDIIQAVYDFVIYFAFEETNA